MARKIRRDWLAPGACTTTGEAAKLCQISQQTIIRCANNGTLKSFRVPGSKHRRILLSDLHQFIVDNKLSTEAIDNLTMHRIILLTQDQSLYRQLKEILPCHRPGGFIITPCASVFLAGWNSSTLHPPDCFMIDLGIGKNEAINVCQLIRQEPNFDQSFLLILSTWAKEIPREIKKLMDFSCLKSHCSSSLGQHLPLLILEKKKPSPNTAPKHN